MIKINQDFRGGGEEKMAENETAEQVKQIVEGADPTKLQEQEASEKTRREMATTMDAMEQARDKVGDFCITFGQGDRRSIVLTEPIEGHKGDTFTERMYVVVTPAGFKAVEFSIRNDGTTSDHILRREQELRSLLQNAENGQVQGREGFWKAGYYEEHGSIYKNGTHTVLKCSEGLTFENWGSGVQLIKLQDGNVVTSAVQNSLAKAQEPHQRGLNDAQTTTQIAGVVRQGLPK